MRKILRIYPKLRRVFYKQYNKFYFWLNGIRFGRNLTVLNKVYILGKGKVTIGDDFYFTSDDALNAICRNIRGALFSVNSDSKIEIGDRVGMSSACLWAKERISIGNDVNIGGDCLIMDNDAHPHSYLYRNSVYAKQIEREKFQSLIPTSPIQIDDNVWIGARCIVLKGVHIGARTIIAAGSVVTRDIPADVIAAGNPAKVIRNLDRTNQ